MKREIEGISNQPHTSQLPDLTFHRERRTLEYGSITQPLGDQEYKVFDIFARTAVPAVPEDIFIQKLKKRDSGMASTIDNLLADMGERLLNTFGFPVFTPHISTDQSVNEKREYMLQAKITPIPPYDQDMTDSSENAGGLTNREREIFNLAMHNLTHQSIASHLNISRRTVVNHLEKIYHKLEVHSLLEAALVAETHGIIHLGDYFPTFDSTRFQNLNSEDKKILDVMIQLDGQTSTIPVIARTLNLHRRVVDRRVASLKHHLGTTNMKEIVLFYRKYQSKDTVDPAPHAHRPDLEKKEASTEAIDPETQRKAKVIFGLLAETYSLDPKYPIHPDWIGDISKIPTPSLLHDIEEARQIAIVLLKDSEIQSASVIAHLLGESNAQWTTLQHSALLKKIQKDTHFQELIDELKMKTKQLIAIHYQKQSISSRGTSTTVYTNGHKINNE